MFPSQFKQAIVTPLLKKHSLPPVDLSSYRPISNLSFLSKVTERVIHNRLLAHLESFPSLSSFQSAYKKLHSTETALLKIHNDLLLSFEDKKLSALVLLDMSAAFDTVDHSILLSRLSSNFGISGSAHSLLTSYLSGRTQSVSIHSSSTPPSPIMTGVPQGSVLGPLLFSLYTTPLTNLLDNSPMSYHLYADDTQLYISFSPNESAESLTALGNTLDSVHSWLTRKKLSLNPSKTEFLLVGTQTQRSKVISHSINFAGTEIKSSPSVRNLGVILDEDLNFSKHISSICKSSYHSIRQLRQIRPSLDLCSSIALSNSLVSCRLDYCNSLYSGLPLSSIHRLQLVQNSLARVIYPSLSRRDHITPILHRLHWLPVHARIKFKVALLTFKTLQSNLPT